MERHIEAYFGQVLWLYSCSQEIFYQFTIQTTLAILCPLGVYKVGIFLFFVLFFSFFLFVVVVLYRVLYYI